MNILVEKNTSAQNINLFNSIIFDIEPLTVRIEEEFIAQLLLFIDEIIQIMQSYQKKDDEINNFRMSIIHKRNY